MKQIAAIIFFITMGLLASEFIRADDSSWMQFRGPNSSGVVANAGAIPVEWSETENIRWKAEIPGLGSSSPIVLNDRVYITSYTGYGIDPEQPGEIADLKRHLLCFDADSGQELWRATVESDHDEDPYEGFIQHHGYASSTPVTDGEFIYAFFGKTGVIAFDLEGNQVWKTNVGTQSDPFRWGGGSSCIVVDDIVVVNAGNEGRAVLGLSKDDGAVQWRIENQQFSNTWSTPVVVETAGHRELVFGMPGTAPQRSRGGRRDADSAEAEDQEPQPGKLVGVDPQSGQLLWEAALPITNTIIPSLTVNGDVVIAMGGRGGQAIAVRCGGKGDVTESHTVWQGNLQAGIGTPVVVDNLLFWNTRGIVYCADAERGELVYKERLEPSRGMQRGKPTGDYASPIAVGDRVYLTNHAGRVFVIRASREFESMGENQFSDGENRFHATPAVGDNRLFFRSDSSLYCVGQ